MAELVLCAECNRHVRGLQCPFCGARVAEWPSSSLGRASRAALFALAAAAPVALLDCAQPAPISVYGGPPTATVAPDDAAAPSGSASATTQAPVVAPPPTTHVSAYGGPPTAPTPVPPPR